MRYYFDSSIEVFKTLDGNVLVHVGKVDGRSELFERRDWLEECIEGHRPLGFSP